MSSAEERERYLLSAKLRRHYILDKQGDAYPVSLVEWARWFEDYPNERILAQDDVDGKRVSTVFLGLDHQYGYGPPLLWETMIFGLDHDEEYCERYSTRDEALAGHKRALARAAKGWGEPEGEWSVPK